jgi:hypothetical protein
MDTTRTHLDNIRSTNKNLQNGAYYAVMEATEKPVGWAYEAWDEMVAGLTHTDNHVRAIAAQVLCNLAKSDPDKRIVRDFDVLLKVTRDEKFVTARHCLQSLWKVGIAGDEQRQVYLAGVEKRFHECAAEKNCTLIRFDISQSLRNVYDAVQDESIRAKALELIETEPDVKYRKKYMTLWKK